MKTLFIRSSLSMLAAAVLMTACGGGADPETAQAQGFVQQIAAVETAAIDGRKRALADAGITVDAKAIFDWAEYTYPDQFPKVPAPQNFSLPYAGAVYTVRAYGSGNYLGVTSNDEVYGLGPFTNHQLMLLGNVSQFAAQVRADACNVYPGSCDAVRAKELFDWAEYTYPELFPKGPQNVDAAYGGVNYIERSYPNGHALRWAKGSADPAVYGIGPLTGNVLLALGKWSDFAARVRADACNVYPGSCGVQTPPGPLNECTDPAAEALQAGFRVRLVYQFSGTLTGEQTVESVIDGPSTFEGQSAVKTTTVSSGTNTVEGQTVSTSTTIETYQQLGTDGVTKTLGSLVQMSIAGFPFSSSKTVYEPARDNLEFRIAEGQTGTIVSRSMTTPGQSGFSDLTETFTFERKEQVTVPAGTFATCRYRIHGENANAYDTTWYILGKGVPAQTESTVNGVVSNRQQLKSGDYNGTPL